MQVQYNEYNTTTRTRFCKKINDKGKENQKQSSCQKGLLNATEMPSKTNLFTVFGRQDTSGDHSPKSLKEARLL